VESDQGRAKAAYAIGLKSGKPFGIAGIWEGWKHPLSGEIIRTFCILTCPANELVGSIHDRMPVILPPEAYERWLANIEPDPRFARPPFRRADDDVADLDAREQARQRRPDHS
jgi:putative SOS response-associated peptidase YedK